MNEPTVLQVESVSKASMVLAVLFHLVVLSIAVWDLYAVAFWSGSDTVSSIIQGWSTRYPVLTFMIGLSAGHVFWPAHRAR